MNIIGKKLRKPSAMAPYLYNSIYSNSFCFSGKRECTNSKILKTEYKLTETGSRNSNKPKEYSFRLSDQTKIEV